MRGAEDDAWRMVYTSYTRALGDATVRHDDGDDERVAFADIPRRLHAMSHGAFRLEWAPLFAAGVHLRCEQLDNARDARGVAALLAESDAHRAFLNYHMRNTIYSWDFGACRVCDAPASGSCSACQAARYCGARCQAADWPRHRRRCLGGTCLAGTRREGAARAEVGRVRRG